MLSIASSATLGATTVSSIPSPSPEPTDLPEGWHLVWSDEFDGPSGSSPDGAKWMLDTGGQGWGNQEWQYYTASPENAALDGNGFLTIVARRVAGSGSTELSCWYGPCRYTSARLLSRTRFSFMYGRVEARLKLPYGQGIWPAFWMLGDSFPEVGWPGCGEIDIMDNIGREPGMVHVGVHGPGYSGSAGISHRFALPSGQAFADDYHVFRLEWEPDELRWYVDGHKYATLSRSQLSEARPWVFDHAFFLILNVAVGGTWPGYPDETTTFPQVLAVDYVRVFQRSPAGN